MKFKFIFFSNRFNVKQLSWTKKSYIKNSEESFSPLKSSHSVISEYSVITSGYLDDSPFQEIDVVGVVVKVLDVKDEMQNVYLSDMDHNFIVLRFSPSVTVRKLLILRFKLFLFCSFVPKFS